MAVTSVETDSTKAGEAVIGVVSQIHNLTTMVEKLIDRMDKMELSHSNSQAGRQMRRNSQAESQSATRTNGRGPQGAPNWKSDHGLGMLDM